MTRVERILERLRPAGAPGTAAPAGVPADRVAELAAELEPVLARLDGVQAQCDRIRTDAAEEADRRRRIAVERARQVVKEGWRAAEAERSAAAAAVEHQVAAEAATARAAGERSAAAVRELGRTRTLELVDRVTAMVRGLAEEPGRAAWDRPEGS
jgi:hypothetical protein